MIVFYYFKRSLDIILLPKRNPLGNSIKYVLRSSSFFLSTSINSTTIKYFARITGISVCDKKRMHLLFFNNCNIKQTIDLLSAL